MTITELEDEIDLMEDGLRSCPDEESQRWFKWNLKRLRKQLDTAQPGGVFQ